MIIYLYILPAALMIIALWYLRRRRKLYRSGRIADIESAQICFIAYLVCAFFVLMIMFIIQFISRGI